MTAYNPPFYVCGFYFNEARTKVVLVEKLRGPDAVIGKLNGVGGKVEKMETPWEAMVREFEEEAGVRTKTHDWNLFLTLAGEWGTVHFLRTTGDISVVRQMEDEDISVYAVDSWYIRDRVVPNLTWILPLAAFTHDEYARVEALEMPNWKVEVS